jgi:hydrogenase 3 maturation protease
VSEQGWQASLARLIAPELGERRRVAVVGVGNELNGDDAAGVEVARALIPPLQGRDDVLVIEGGPAPENVSGALRRFAPDAVLLIDAADLGEPPGKTRWIDFDAITGLSASTHTLPLSLLARYLSAELGCEVALLGIQPGDLSFGAPLSAPVRAAVEAIITAIRELINHGEHRGHGVKSD